MCVLSCFELYHICQKPTQNATSSSWWTTCSVFNLLCTWTIFSYMLYYQHNCGHTNLHNSLSLVLSTQLATPNLRNSFCLSLSHTHTYMHTLLLPCKLPRYKHTLTLVSTMESNAHFEETFYLPKELKTPFWDRKPQSDSKTIYFPLPIPETVADIQHSLHSQTACFQCCTQKKRVSLVKFITCVR